MFQLLWHQIFINLYNNSRKKLFGSFSSNVAYTEKELSHFWEIQRLLCTIWLYYYQILSGIKLEPSPIPVIRDGICLLQFSYLLVAFLVNTKKQAAVRGNSSHCKINILHKADESFPWSPKFTFFNVYGDKRRFKYLSFKFVTLRLILPWSSFQ